MQFLLDIFKRNYANLHLDMRLHNMRTGYGGNARLKKTQEKITMQFRNYILIYMKFSITQQIIYCNVWGR